MSVVALALVAGLGLAGCSSSSGVSQSQVESKLKSESSVKTVLAKGGTEAQKANKIIDCAAKALVKDANQSDLKQYVDGKISINKIKPKSASAKNDAKSILTGCEKSLGSS